MMQTDGKPLKLNSEKRRLLRSLLSRHIAYAHTSEDKDLAREILKEIQDD